ncbi:MAG: hypothetical protein BHV77_19325 [Bacteroides sp. 43_108]|nr:MAG: hypothetical protein BHV77_19325 [Bacteroides sp. 43_108]
MMNAQSLISGCVKNGSGESVEGAIVTLFSLPDSSILSYQITGVDGKFTVSSGDSTSDSLMVRLSGFNIKTKAKTVQNKSQNMDLVAVEDILELKEVLVKAEKIWGDKDTLNYLVASFLTNRDVSIGDVLKRLPGISVSEDGMISYNGIPINKFYIENLDVLQGRYNIATEGISAKDVSTVQVLEHHQPIKALQKDSRPEQAAINLQLKDNKKGTWLRSAELGLGFSDELLWKNSISLMYFGRKSQHVLTYDNANNGSQITRKAHSFYGGGGGGGQRFTGISGASRAPFDPEYTLYNNAHVLTLNNLQKFSDTDVLHYNLVYSHDRTKTHSSSRTVYSLPDGGTAESAEDKYSRETTDNLSLELDYESNRPHDYLSNTLSFSGNWRESFGTIEIGEGETVEQRSPWRSLVVSDEFSIIHTNEDGKGYSLSARLSYNTSPHSLTVSPGVFPDVLNMGDEYGSVRQDMRVRSLKGGVGTSLLSAVKIGRFSMSPSLNVNIEHVHMHSDISVDGTELTADSMRNAETWLRLDADAGLNFNYEVRNLKIELGVPVKYMMTRLGNAGFDDETRHKVLFSPNVNIKYIVFQGFELKASGRMNTGTPSWNSMYSGFILGSYNSLRRNQPQFYDITSYQGTFSTSYRNVLNMLFASVNVHFSRSDNEVMNSMYINPDASIVSTRIFMDNHSTSYGVSGEFSKAFFWCNASMKLSGGWNRGFNCSLRQNELMKNVWDNGYAGIEFSMKPAKRLYTAVYANYSCSRSRVERVRTYPAVHRLNGSIEASFDITDEFYVGAKFRHRYNSAVDGDRNFSLLDMNVVYKLKKVRFSLDVYNLLNKKKYVVRSYSNLDEYYSEYDIRPRSFMLTAKFNF